MSKKKRPAPVRKAKPARKPVRAKKVWPGPSEKAVRALAAKKARAKQPRNVPLIGMEDARIQELEDIGASYADIRDQRIALNQEESSLKTLAISLMHKHGKTIYKTDSIEIVVEAGDETVKVKLKKPKEVDAEGPADTVDSGDDESNEPVDGDE